MDLSGKEPGGKPFEGIGIALRRQRAGEHRKKNHEKKQMHGHKGEQSGLSGGQRAGAAADRAGKERFLQTRESGKPPAGEQKCDQKERHGGEIMVNERAARHEHPRQIDREKTDGGGHSRKRALFYGAKEGVHHTRNTGPPEQRAAEHGNCAERAVAVGVIIAIIPDVAHIEGPLVPRGFKGMRGL